MLRNINTFRFCFIGLCLQSETTAEWQHCQSPGCTLWRFCGCCSIIHWQKHLFGKRTCGVNWLINHNKYTDTYYNSIVLQYKYYNTIYRYFIGINNIENNKVSVSSLLQSVREAGDVQLWALDDGLCIGSISLQTHVSAIIRDSIRPHSNYLSQIRRISLLYLNLCFLAWLYFR